MPADRIVLQGVEGAVNARRLAPCHAELFPDVVDAFSTGPIPPHKRVECLPCEGVVLATPVDPRGLVGVESECNPLPQGVLALTDPFPFFGVVAEWVVSMPA